MSFDTSGQLGGVDFDDEDVLEYDPGGGTWELVFDGSAEHASWSASDLDGVHLVPEPNGLWGMVGGVAFLVVAKRRRMRLEESK